MLDYGRCGFFGDRANIGKRLRLDVADARLCSGNLLREVGFDTVAIGLGLRLGGFACGIGNRMALGSGACQFLLVGGDGRVGFALQTRCLVEILRDAVMARLENRAYAGMMTFDIRR